MAGLQGQSRAPDAPVRERRNFDNLSEVLEFIDPNEPIQISGDGAFTLQLATDGGLVVSSAELAVQVQGVLAIDASGLKVNVGSGLENASGDLVVSLATNPGLEFELGDLRVKAGDGLVRDSSGIRLGVLTTAGDLLVRDGSGFARLPVGSDDQVLTADSAASLGVKWADASGGGGSGLLDRSTGVQDSGFNDRHGNAVAEVTIPVGTLPNSSTKDVAHGITDLSIPGLVELQGWASNGTTTRPLPWADGTDAIGVEVDATNLSITTNFDATGYTDCDVFLRYVPAESVSVEAASDVTYGSGGSISSISQTVPAASASGDLVVAILFHRSGTSGITGETGFSRDAQQGNDGSDFPQWIEVWSREDDGTLGGSSIEFTASSSGRMGLIVLVLRSSGSGSVSVEDTAGADYLSSTNPGVETIPSATAGGPGRVLVGIATCAYALNSGDTIYEFPSGEGWTQHTPTSTPDSPSHERNRLCVATQGVGLGATPTADVSHELTDHDAGMLAVVFTAS